MSKYTIAKLIREEIHNLNRLAEQLEDESRLCEPRGYDCSGCLGGIMVNLKRIKKLSRGIEYPWDIKDSSLRFNVFNRRAGGSKSGRRCLTYGREY